MFDKKADKCECATTLDVHYGFSIKQQWIMKVERIGEMVKQTNKQTKAQRRLVVRIAFDISISKIVVSFHPA